MQTMELPEECVKELSEGTSLDSASTFEPSDEMASEIDRIRSFREAGAVERSHTIPHKGSYSNAMHQWNAASLLLCLHPDPSAELVKYVLWHDIAERWLGDSPSPAKNDHTRAEEKRILSVMKVPVLNEEDQIWATAVDKLELWCWCFDEQAMGNMNCRNVVYDLSRWFSKPGQLIPDACLQFYYQYKWERGRELGDL